MWNIKILFVACFVIICFGQDYTPKTSLIPTSNQALLDWEFQKLLHEAEYDDALQVEEEGLLHVNKAKQKSLKKELYLKKPLKKQQNSKLRKVKTVPATRNLLRYKELSKKNHKKINEFMKNIDPNKIQSDSKNIVNSKGKHFVYDKKTALIDTEGWDRNWKNAEKKKSEPRRNVSNYYKPREIESMKNRHRPKRAVTAKKERLWDYGVIPYEIDKIFSGFHKALFKQAMRHWENFTCIKFVERDPKIHKNFIYFTVRNCGCCSFVGKRGNGRQAISIGRNCEKFGIVVHELGHVIGFWHEHTRIDRDKHIQINRANILKGQEYNFNVLSPEDVDSLGLPYDYNSIMHYARNTFSKSVYLDTILPIRDNGENKPDIGQRIHLSNGDIGQANLLYQCPKCGRTYQQNSGEISSPHFYSKESENTEEKCEWRITATHGERIILNIIKMNIIETPNCQDNYLEIRDGYWLKSPLIKRLCGNTTSEVTTISSRMLVTYVNTNLHLGYNGFKAEFEVVCGGDLFITEDHRIDSPNYPLEYLPDKECIWKITVPEDHQVALKFHVFEIENHDSCIYDYVEIRDGDSATSELIGIFCGYKLPPNIKSNSNKMFVKFVSDSSVQKVGFSATFMKEVDECKTGDHGCDHECINTLGSYECDCHAGYELQNDGRTCEDACGGVFDTTNGTLTSPSYPDVYPILKQCIWEIIAPEKHSVFLNFTHFDLEGTKYHYMECNYDYITIYSKLKDNRLRKIGVFCGNELPPVVKSEQNILRIEFYSDKSIQHTGFIGNFFTDYDECATNNGGCMHNCRNTYGSYECSCRNGYTLHENGHNCSETNCKFEITNPYGLIYSPNYPHEYPRNTYCFWHFSTVPGHRIQLIFNEFDVEDHQECIYDYVAIYDGNSENSSTLGVYCGGRQPYTVVASTNEMFMVLKTDIGLQKKGFIATHSTECGGYLRATNQTRHFLSHPKYGYKNYKRNMYCTWRIQADVHNSVKLTFSTFEVEYSEKCNYDFVEITEEPSLIRRPHHGKFCGNQKPPEIISLSDTLLVRFQTDESTSLKGFSASYIAVDPPEVDEVLDYEDTLATPFPGYMKSVYLTDSMYYDEYEDFSRIPIRMNKARKNLQ